MKKYVSLFLVGVLALSLVACGGGPVTDSKKDGMKGSSKNPSDITLTMMASQGWTYEGDENVIQNFKEKTGITVDLQVTPSAQHHDLLKAKLTSNEGPDLFMAQTNQFMIKTNTVDPEKYCIDLTNEDFISIMPEYRLPAISYNDKVYGLMVYPNSPEFITIYNKTLFEEAGVTKLPETFEEFKSVCQTILDFGVVPVYESVADGWHHQLPFFQIGPRYEQLNPGLYEGLNNNTIKFAEVDTFATVLNQINEMAQLGYYGEHYMSNLVNVTADVIANREAAMVYANPGLITKIKEEYPEVTDEYGMFLLRFLDNNTFPTNPSGPALFGYAQSPYQNEILEFMRFSTEKESLQTKLDGAPEWTNIDVTVDIEQKFPPEEEEFMSQITEEQKNIQVVLQTGTKYTNDQIMDLGADMASMFMGQLTAQEVLKGIDERRANIAKSQNDPNWN